MATALAGGYVVALVLGVFLVDAQVRGWNEDAMVIAAFAYSFNGTERSLRSLLVTKDLLWANESLWWGAIAADLAYDTFLRSGFPSGAALGLTHPNIDCSYMGFREFLRGVDSSSDVDHPATIASVEQWAGVYGDLWTALRWVRPQGTDPLNQLGADQVQTIRGLVAELRTLGEHRWGQWCIPPNWPN